MLPTYWKGRRSNNSIFPLFVTLNYWLDDKFQGGQESSRVNVASSNVTLTSLQHTVNITITPYSSLSNLRIMAASYLRLQGISSLMQWSYCTQNGSFLTHFKLLSLPSLMGYKCGPNTVYETVTVRAPSPIAHEGMRGWERWMEIWKASRKAHWGKRGGKKNEPPEDREEGGRMVRKRNSS